MKRILMIITSFCILTANAQNYLISFAGNGASTSVNSVKVENLTKGTNLTLNGSDILHLTVLTGFNSIDYRQSSELNIYPNPMNGNAILQVSPPATEKAIFSVLDMTGKLVVQVPIYLENCPQEFHLSGLKSGFYLISINGNSFHYSGKLLCHSKEAGTISIEKISNNQFEDEKIIKTNSKGELSTIDMDYTIGNRLKFMGISGNFSTVITDIPTLDKTITFNFISCIDGDNNNYPVVAIGTQVWMAENLKTTKDADGTNIAYPGSDNVAWQYNKAGAYAWYNNDEAAYKDTYGALYNWYAVNAGKLCPNGWHMPTDIEWTTLTTYLGGESVSGGKLKETGTTHWMSPNLGATNETGFTALPDGSRYLSDTQPFQDIRLVGDWWSATGDIALSAWIRNLGYADRGVNRGTDGMTMGFSVRCIKDN
jgi:uncharacterized protein (TIGR02145 family)